MANNNSIKKYQREEIELLWVVYFSALSPISRRLYLGGFSVILQSSCIVPISFLYRLYRGGVKEKYSKDEKLKTKDEMQEAKKRRSYTFSFVFGLLDF